MANITLKGNPIHTSGELPSLGDKVPDFTLVDAALGEKRLADFAGKKKILTINPSYDTGVCQAAARNFSKKAGDRCDATVLVISADLPFAQKRFCAAEGIDNVVALSSFRSSFARDYGIELVDGPLRGLTARAVLVLDENDQVIHSQLVPEIGQEPDYDAALAALD
jgi:thioredoxin-dependent peroxiredoxin